MSFNYRITRPAGTWGPHIIPPTQTETDDNVAEVSAGVVAGADLYSQPSAPKGKFMVNFQDPATWAYVWIGVSLLYLVGVYVGAIRISGRER